MRQAAHIPANTIDGTFTKVDMSSVYCIACHQPGTLDDTRTCELCRVRPAFMARHDGERNGILTIIAILTAVTVIVWAFADKFEVIR